MTMDDISLLYNVNLCRICQNPQNTELVNTTSVNNQTYVDTINNLFSDIVWIDDKLTWKLCKVCSTQLDVFVEFKRLYLETTERRRLHILKLSTTEQSSEVVVKTELKIEIVDSMVLSKPSYQCSSCSESFEKKLVLRRHEKRVHGSSMIANKKGNKIRKENVKIKTTSGKVKKMDSDEDLLGRDLDDSDGECVGNGVLKTEENLPSELQSTPNFFYKPSPGETTCRICSRSFCRTQRLISHINNIHTRTIQHRCTICRAGFTNLDKLNRHISHHTGARDHVCPQCGSKFITANDLCNHMQVHSAVRKYKCDRCEKSYKTPSTLRTHKIVVHTNRDEFKYLCTECGSKFPSQSGLNAHMIRHTQTKKFKCHVCPKEFFTNGELKTHVVAHTNVRNYKCHLCPAEYKQKQILALHKSRRHQIGNLKFTPAKKYPCGYCGRIISSKDKLKRHERTHTGEKPYQCRLCGMRFICRSYIKGHLRGKHEIDVETADFDQNVYYESTTEEGAFAENDVTNKDKKDDTN